VPYSPSTGDRARSDDPTTWANLNEARRAVEEEGHDGIGFVFTADDPFCGVDLDGCVDRQTGEIQPWAADILDRLDSYTEFSPSGEGLHVIVRAELPEGRRRGGGVEMYDRGRFFTVTDRHLPGTPKQVENRQGEISTLHARLFPPHEKIAPLTNRSEFPKTAISDEEILRRAMRANNSDKFAALWSGDRTGYTSGSEADLALLSMLAFWTGPDEERVASLFARSGLMRDKWNRPDYRRRTIAQALEGAEFHNPSKNGAVPPRNGHSGASEIAFLANPGLPPTLPEAPRFPVDAMPTACRTLIEESEKALGCAPELVALPMLAVLSSAIGTSRVVEIKGGWREWPALFLAVVASPGAMKTPAAKVSKKPAFDRQRKLGKSYAEDKEDYKREVRQWDVDKREAQKNSEPAPEEPETPTMSRCVASDTTVEALVGILEDNPRGLLLHKDELAGWVRSMDQYKGGKGSDRQHWLSFWSCDEVVVDRKSRMGEPLIVAKPFVSLFGGIQPAMLGELGAGAEDGLMDRFLFAYPKPRQVRFTEDEISEKAQARYTTLHDKLANLTLATDEHGDPNPKPLKLSREARALFAKRVDDIGAQMLEPGFPSRLEGVWSKLRGHLARLSLVLAVCRCVENDLREERVEVEDIEAASRLLAYFAAHARRVYAELSAPDPLDLLAADLKTLVETNGGRLEATATELHQALEEIDCEALPTRPKELSQAVKAVAAHSPVLRVAFGHRGKERVIRLKLIENTVGSVGSYGDQSTSTDATDATDARTESDGRPDNPLADATNATDARSRANSPEASVESENDVNPVVIVDPPAKYAPRDNGTNGNPPRERNKTAEAKLAESDDKRSRFTL
ncbi:MAG: DUF3987 domain-containing protein, partial [Actinomycetota bacterium]|nr:DUF3987 domain-containing protein [Actinomycetota bacterium]